MAWGSAIIFVPADAAAHAFGERYDLPVPLWLFMTAAGAAVALSFVALAVGFRPRSTTKDFAQLDLDAGMRAAPARWLLRGLRVVSVALFIFLCYAGLFGDQAPTHNILPTLLWVGLWVGLAYFAALAGNPWPALNPYAIVFDWARAGREALSGRAAAHSSYPSWLGAWPAVFGLLTIAWIELVPEGGERPALLAAGMLGYGLYCWAGLWAFGDRWLERADVLTVAFGVLGRFAPVGIRTDASDRRWVLRWPGTGLLKLQPLSTSMVVFVLLMLSNVTFDGFLETPLWREILDAIATSQTLRPMLIELQGAGVNLLGAIKTLGLVVFPLIFLASYAAVCFLMSRLGGNAQSTWATARWFVLTLVPIAIAYHLAHYASFFALAGQLLIPLVSDPLGRGWDLFGTAHVHVDPSVISARFVWYTAVTTIVIGHVIAVVLSHFQAHRVFADPRSALLSQLPMLVLMVGYTMTSLWILSQPVVKSSALV